ncbi:MAG: ABC transporter substrate-binding protein [Rhizobiales bacterium]|nr:ABC transporter substrate-binding protein [Hyphomicrobiales bacterium]
MRLSSRGVMLATGIVAASLAVSGSALGQDVKSIKIGWAISKTGPNTAGASITLLNAYKLWVKDVNDAGKVPVEVVEYDDRSNSEEMIKAVERLINQDKVDFLFPAWGTAFTLASAPVFARAGYPLIAVTATTDRAPEFAKRWPNTFWLLGTGTSLSGSLVEVLSKLRTEGKIGNKVAMAGVADQFGIELSTATRKSLQTAKFDLVYDKSYPIGSQDMQPVLTEAKRAEPDVFIAASYPPDTFAITAQAKIVDFNPKVFFTAVGTAFPLFKQRFGADIEGVMGTGGTDADSQVFKNYLKRHVALSSRTSSAAWTSPTAAI